MVLAREVRAPIIAICRFTMHLLVAGKAHHRSDTSHSRHIGVSKGKLHFNGIDKQSRVGMRVVFDVTRYLEGGHIF
jgi:hypothetical protein